MSVDQRHKVLEQHPRRDTRADDTDAPARPMYNNLNSFQIWLETRAVPKFGFAEDFGRSRTEGFGSVQPTAIFGRSSAEVGTIQLQFIVKYVSFSTKKRRRRLVP